MKKLVILLSAILILANLVFAQENMGARPIGMGGAFTGLADDANAIFVNPAGLAYLSGELATVSTKISEGKEYTLIGGVERTSFGCLGIGFISSYSPVDQPDTAVYDDPGDVPVKALNQTLVVSYARELNDFMVVPKNMGRLSVGSNLRMTSYRVNNAKGLSDYEDSKLDLDLGAVFRPNDSLAWGLTLKEFFGKAGPEGVEDAPSGPTLAAGVSGKIGDSLILSVEGQSLGCEYKPISELALRVGRDGAYSTAGIGVNIEGFAVDYAYLGKEAPVHYFAISIAIEKAPDHRQASVY